MKRKLTIPAKLRPNAILLWMLILLFFLAWLPSGIKYLLDVGWCCLLVFLLRFWKRVDTKPVAGLILWVAAFFLTTLSVYLVQYQSLEYYLWGLRNNFRFYAAFFAAALFLSREDTRGIWQCLEGLFWGNALVMLVQFCFLGLRGDHLGGLFGWEKGCNGYTNLFFVLILTKSVVFYLEGLENGGSCFAKCAAALLTAALAEIKFFFVEYAVILLLAVLFSPSSRRKFRLAAGGILGICLFAVLLSVLFPEFGGWFTPKRMLATAISAKGYSSAGDLNRLTAISGINKKVFENWGQRLFGLGLGNCDCAGYDFLTTPFYRAYEYLHYTWMSLSFVYIEMGYVGLVFFFGFFGLVFFAARRQEKHCGGEGKALCRVGEIMAVLCVLIGIYNSSLRTEAGYFAGFALAVPFGRERT